jgi:hypothetical protein
LQPVVLDGLADVHEVITQVRGSKDA